MVTAYYIITNSGYAVQYCILYRVQGYTVYYCLMYHHRGYNYVALHTASLQLVDTQCVTAYCIIKFCLGVCRVITVYCVITGGGLYGTA